MSNLQMTLDAILEQQRQTNRSLETVTAELSQLNEQLQDQRDISDDAGREIPAAIDRLTEILALANDIWTTPLLD